MRILCYDAVWGSRNTQYSATLANGFMDLFIYGSKRREGGGGRARVHGKDMASVMIDASDSLTPHSNPLPHPLFSQTITTTTKNFYVCLHIKVLHIKSAMQQFQRYIPLKADNVQSKHIAGGFELLDIGFD